MRCLSPIEAEAAFAEPKFHVSLEHPWYRSALYLDSARAKKQKRIAAELPFDIRVIPRFVRSLNRWFPSNRGRLLSIDHWETGGFDEPLSAIAATTWRGLGEERSLTEAPGLYFDPQDWQEEDRAVLSPAQENARGLLVGVTAMVMMSYSDGWLISTNCVDRIEFWEGHFFFHSEDLEKLALANAILDEFSCKRWKS